MSMNGAVCCNCNIIISLFTVQNCGLRKSVDCPMEEAEFLRNKFLCRGHFFLTDFVTPGGIHLNRLAVACGLDSASHSIPQSSPPLLPTLSNPQTTAVTPLNSNLPALPPLPRVLFHWSREPVHFVSDTRHKTPVHIISWTVLHYSHMCHWK